MTRYYFNENPQATYHLNKIEALERELEFATRYNDMLIRQYNTMSEQVDTFNSLPWYKKIFYKFNV